MKSSRFNIAMVFLRRSTGLNSQFVHLCELQHRKWTGNQLAISQFVHLYELQLKEYFETDKGLLTIRTPV